MFNMTNQAKINICQIKKIYCSNLYNIVFLKKQCLKKHFHKERSHKKHKGLKEVRKAHQKDIKGSREGKGPKLKGKTIRNLW